MQRTEEPKGETRGPATGEERRQHDRVRTLKKGQIVTQGHNCAMDCVMLDLSEGGAKLRPDDILHCPDQFILKMADGTSQYCQVVRHDSDILGVQFIKPVRPKVLLVDDDSDQLQLYKTGLSKHYDVHAAQSADLALELLDSEGPFAVLVTDLRMPTMDGLQFIRVAKEQALETTRILLTGYAELKTAIDAVNQGNVFRILTKPCAIGDLGRAISDGILEYQRAIASSCEGTKLALAAGVSEPPADT